MKSEDEDNKRGIGASLDIRVKNYELRSLIREYSVLRYQMRPATMGGRRNVLRRRFQGPRQTSQIAAPAGAAIDNQTLTMLS